MAGRLPNGQFAPATLKRARDGTPMKQCSRCRRWKKVDAFYVRTRGTDGQPASWSARCRYCGKVAQRHYMGYGPRKPKRTPEEERRVRLERYRERMAAIHADPALLANHRVDMRLKEKLRRERNGSRTNAPLREFNGHEIADAYRGLSWRYDTVDAMPFVVWLLQRFPHWEPSEIADALALSDRRVRELLSGQARVTLDLVDRALTVGLGRPDLLNAIYPFEL